MSDTTDTTATGVEIDPDAGYVENPDHVPNPTYQTGTVDTSGTAGRGNDSVKEVTAIFDVAEKQDMAVAARALDPDDPTPSSLVNVSTGQRMHAIDPDAERDLVRSKAEARAAEPVTLPYKGPAQRQAAESGPEGAALADSQQADQGVGGEATSATDAEKRLQEGPGADEPTAEEEAQLAAAESDNGWYEIGGRRVHGRASALRALREQ